VGITVLKNNVPWGPFTRAQINEGLNRGDFTLRDLAHAEGFPEWTPLSDVLQVVDRAPLPPVPVTRDLPPIPVPVKSTPPPFLPTAEQRAPKKVVAPPIPRPEVQLTKAPFIRRTIAFLVDCAILFVPIIFIFCLGAATIAIQGLWEHTDGETMHQEWALLRRDFYNLLLLVAIGFAWLYAAGLESSRWQATPGKQWMGLKVTDAGGERISFLRATGRHAGKYLSALPCFLGFVSALFSSRGLALHDRLADTRVIRR